MPRSRMIRPEFWDDEKLSKVSVHSRLIFIGLWTHSDDYGNVKGNPLWLRNHILPYEDSLSTHVFLKYLQELEEISCIIKFEHKGEVFYHIRNFLKHQKVNRPSQQRNPTPPAELLNEDSLSTHGTLIDETETEFKQKQNKKIPPEIKPESKKFSPKNEQTSGSKSGTFKPKKTVTKKQFDFENLPGIFEDIKKQCESIKMLQVKKPKQRAFNPKLWVQSHLKTKKHPGALLKSLDGLEIYWEQAREPWGYCDDILGKVNGNFNEASHIKENEYLKNITIPELKELAAGLLDEMPI